MISTFKLSVSILLKTELDRTYLQKNIKNKKAF